MLKGKSIYTWLFAALVATGAASCKKNNGIDNNNVIRTPYSLYFSDAIGSLYNTNDGVTFENEFPGDGYMMRSIVVSGPNIIAVKKNTHLSEDNSLNFNPTDSSPAAYAHRQSMMIHAADQKRVYLASTKAYGIIYSEDNGKTWQNDSAWTDDILVGTPPRISSMTQLLNGELYAYDGFSQNLYRRANKTADWTKVSIAGGLPASNTYFLSHINNTLVAADSTGQNIYYSDNFGVNWDNYTGLPSGVQIYTVEAPFNEGLFIGTANGVYKNTAGEFLESVSNGLEAGTRVYSIKGKRNIYKDEDETEKSYIYIATNKGIYRSEDFGQNWILVYPGNFTTLY